MSGGVRRVPYHEGESWEAQVISACTPPQSSNSSNSCLGVRRLHVVFAIGFEQVRLSRAPTIFGAHTETKILSTRWHRWMRGMVSIRMTKVLHITFAHSLWIQSIGG